jgi:hypothetical protein
MTTNPNMFTKFISIFALSSQAADRLYGIANIALIVGALIVLVGTILAIWTSGVRERYADIRISNNEAETESARRDAAQAIERAASLEKDAQDVRKQVAQSNESAAIAQKDAEQSRLAQEELKAQVSWRTISAGVASQMIVSLSASPSEVHIGSIANDPESQFLAFQFSKIFSEAKWTVTTSARTYGGFFFGVSIPDATNTGVAKVREIFTNAGIAFVNTPIPAAPMFMGSAQPGTAVFIMVGSKQQPF